jgi:hypothetical protein
MPNAWRWLQSLSREYVTPVASKNHPVTEEAVHYLPRLFTSVAELTKSFVGEIDKTE